MGHYFDDYSSLVERLSRNDEMDEVRRTAGAVALQVGSDGDNIETPYANSERYQRYGTEGSAESERYN